jgi:hypothetical protein
MKTMMQLMTTHVWRRTSAKSVSYMFMGDYALLRGGLVVGETMQQPAGQEAQETMLQREAMTR